MPLPSKVGRIHKKMKRKNKRNEVLKILVSTMDNRPISADQQQLQQQQLQQPSSSSSQGNVSGGGGIGNSSDYHNEFFNTGRVGRRNALPDILGNHCHTSTADLPDKLNALSTQDDLQNVHQSSSSSTINNPFNQTDMNYLMGQNIGASTSTGSSNINDGTNSVSGNISTPNTNIFSS